MPTPAPKRRWLRLSPDRFVISLLLGVCLLWLSERFQWFGFNHHKGWTVLIAVAAVGVTAIVMLLWWIGALIFARRFQFGIRSLLAFCLACSIAVSWMAVKLQQAEKQREVVEGIQNSGGFANYDWRVGESGDATISTKPPAPEWLRRMLGDDFFSAVAAVGSAAPDDEANGELERIKGLTELKSLKITNANFTDAMLQPLNGMTQLQSLSLDGTQVTGTGFVHLVRSTQLKWLWLNYTPVTDAGLTLLKSHIALHGLALDNTRITDAGLKQLEDLAQLERLDLQCDNITDAGLQAISGHGNLRRLDISKTLVRIED